MIDPTIAFQLQIVQLEQENTQLKLSLSKQNQRIRDLEEYERQLKQAYQENEHAADQVIAQLVTELNHSKQLILHLNKSYSGFLNRLTTIKDLIKEQADIIRLYRESGRRELVERLESILDNPQNLN